MKNPGAGNLNSISIQLSMSTGTSCSSSFAGDSSCISGGGARFGVLILPSTHTESFARSAGVARAKSAMRHYCHWDHGRPRADAFPQLLCRIATRLGDSDELSKFDRASRSLGVLPASIESTSSRSGRRGAEPNLLAGPSSGPRASGVASPRVAYRSNAARWCPQPLPGLQWSPPERGSNLPS
jgi:hypothetical protein